MSRLEAVDVWIADARRPLLAPTSVAVESGSAVVVAGDPGHRHTLLALALGGRIDLGGGTVLLDGDPGRTALHRGVALVDVPGVSDPDDVIALTTIVGEELAMAGRPARRRHVQAWLEENGLLAHRDDRLEDLPSGIRTTALARLAALRPGVEFLVLALPERHGVDPNAWLGVVEELTGAGLGVLATTSTGLVRHVEERAPEVAVHAFGTVTAAPEPEPEPEPDPDPGPDSEEDAR